MSFVLLLIRLRIGVVDQAHRELISCGTNVHTRVHAVQNSEATQQDSKADSTTGLSGTCGCGRKNNMESAPCAKGFGLRVPGDDEGVGFGVVDHWQRTETETPRQTIADESAIGSDVGWLTRLPTLAFPFPPTRPSLQSTYIHHLTPCWTHRSSPFPPGCDHICTSIDLLQHIQLSHNARLRRGLERGK